MPDRVATLSKALNVEIRGIIKLLSSIAQTYALGLSPDLRSSA